MLLTLRQHVIDERRCGMAKKKDKKKKGKKGKKK